MRLFFFYAIRVYQLTLSFWLGGRCRFTPTCSHYMQEAIMVHGVLRGVSLGLKRIAKCGPRGGHGFDPVPPLGYEGGQCSCCHTDEKGKHTHG